MAGRETIRDALLEAQRTRNDACFAIVDRDLTDMVTLTDNTIPRIAAWRGIAETPLEWKSPQGSVFYGWTWERKEIENYLLDPDVVTYALDLSESDSRLYRTRLEDAANGIYVYEAARTALSLTADRLLHHSVSNKWGDGRHAFPGISQISEQDCRQQIMRIHQEYVMGSLSYHWTLNLFNELLPEFEPSGSRRRDFLTTFAGKDILAALFDMNSALGFGKNPSMNTRQLCHFVLKRLENKGVETTQGFLLPEWQSFANLISNF